MIYPSLFNTPPLPKKQLSYAQSQAFYRLDNPVGDPFGGPAFGQWESSGFWGGIGDTFRSAMNAIGSVASKIYTEVIQPVGKALEKVGQSIAKDPITFVAQVAAVAAQQYWAVPLITAASTAAKGGSFEDIIKATAISAATTWIGVNGSEWVTSGLQTGVNAAGNATYAFLGNTIQASTATTIGNVVGMSAAGAIGAAATGRDPLTAALTNGIGAALPFALNEIPGYSSLAGTVASISNTTVGKAVANAVTGTLSGAISAAVTGADYAAGAMKGLIGSVTNSLGQIATKVVDMFETPDFMKDLPNMSDGAKSILAGMTTQVMASALSGGKVTPNINGLFYEAFQKSMVSAIKDGGAGFSAMSDKISELYTNAKNYITGYQDTQFEFEGIAEERNALADQAKQEYIDYDVLVESYRDEYEQYEGLHDQYVEEGQQLSSMQTYINALATELNSSKSKIEAVQSKYSDSAQKANSLIERKQITDDYTLNKIAERGFNSAFRSAFGPANSQLMDSWLAANGLTVSSAISLSNIDEAEIAYLRAQYEYDVAKSEYEWFQANPSYKKDEFGPAAKWDGTYLRNKEVSLPGAKSSYDAAVLNYQTYLDNSNSYKKEADAIKAQYDKIFSEYEIKSEEYDAQSEAYKDTISNINSIASNLEQQRNAIKQKEDALANWSGTIKEYDDQLAELETMLNKYATDYSDASKQLDEAAKPLTDVANEFAKEATMNVVKALDPNFNEAQYKNINGLGAESDAYAHWLQVGKDQGLYTNNESAAVDQDQQYNRLMWDVAAKNGRSLMSYSPEERADLRDKLYGLYGDNISALKTATVDTVLKESGMDVEQFLSKTAKEYTPASDWFKNKEWNKPKDYAPPSGAKLATHEDVLNGKAYQSVDSSGDTVWLTSDGSQDTRVYDKELGEMVTKITVIGEGDDGAILNDDDGVDVKAQTSSLPSTSLDDVDPFSAIEFFGSMDTGVVANIPEAIGNLNREGIKAMADGSKILLDYAKSTGSDTFYTVVQRGLDVGATGLAGLAQVVSATASVASLIMGTNPNDSDLQKVANGLKDWSNATSSAEFKYATAKMEAAMKSAEGGDVAAAIINNAKEFPVDFALKYIGTNLVSFLPGVGLGFAAAKGATAAAKIAGFSDDAIVKLAAGTGLTTQRAYEMAQEAGSAGLQAFNETKAALQKKNPTWSEDKLNDEAMNRAQIVAGTAALATLATQAVGLDKVAQNIFLGGGSSNSVLAPMMSKLISTLSETVGEGWQSFVPQAMQNILMLEIDPTIDAKKALIQETFLGTIGGFGQAGAINTLSAVQDLPAMYLAANQAFESQIKAGNYTMGELGTVLNDWIPKDSALAENMRNQAVPTIFEKYPQFALPYKDASSFLEAVKNDLGVWEVTAVDAVDTKFDDEVVTQKEAVKLLEDKGLVNVSFEDVNKAGVMGLLTNNTASKALDYANQNMVYAEDLRAAAAKENYAATQQELDALLGRGVKADVIQQFIQQADPKATTAEEATQFFKDEGYNSATAAEIAQFVKSSSESDMQKAIVAYVDPHQVTRQEAVDYFKSINYTPTEAEINQFIVQGPEVAQENIYKNIAQFVDPRYTTTAEVQAAALKQGYTMSAEEAAQFAGQYNQASKEADAEAYADKLAVLAEEARQYFALEGYTPTAEDIANYTGVRNEEDAAKLIAAYADPLVMTEAEARQYMSELGYSQPTAEELAQFVKQASESGTKDALTQYVDNHQVTRSEAVDFFAKLGYTPTEEEIANYIKQGAGISQADVQAVLGTYVDPRFVDASEVRDAFKALGLQAPISQEDVARFSGQYEESSLAARAKEALPVVSSNAMFALLNGNPAANQQVSEAILQKIEDYKNLGLDQAAAQKAATEAVAAQLGVTEAKLLDVIGATESNLLVKISNVEANLTTKIDEYKNQGLTQAEATNKALEDMSAQLGTTKADLLSQLGATEANVVTKITATKQELLDKVAEYRAQGMAENAALQAAMTDLSGQFGTSKEQLLAQIGTTETALRGEITQQVTNLGTQLQAQIKANEDAGMSRDAAISAAVNSVAQDLGTTRTALLNQIGATESTLGTRIDTLQQQTQAQINTMQSAIQAQMQKNLDAGMASDAALNKAIQDVATQANTTAQSLLAQMGMNQQQLQAQILASQQAGQQYTQQQVSQATKQIQDQMALYQQAGYDRDTALSLAVSTVAQDLGTTKTDLLTKLGTTETNLRTEFTTGLSDVKNSILAKVAEYQQQGLSSDQALQAAIDTVSQQLGTTKSQLLGQIGTTETALRSEITTQVSQSEKRLADLIATNENQGMQRDQALQLSIDQLAKEQGTTRADLLNKIDITSQQFQNEIQIAKTDLSNQLVVVGQQTQQQIADTKAQIQSQMAAYQSANMDADTALSLAIAGVAQDLGVSKSDLLSKIGTSETNLRTEFTQQTTALSTQVQDVAKLLGKPASQVTANDVTMVQNMIAGTEATNLGYDVNRDGKVDTNDLTLIQQQQQIQQGTNVTQTIDPTTGLPVYTDTTTGKVISGFTPDQGSPWAASGIHAELERQKAQAAATAKAQAAKAKTAQQQSQFGQLMGMLFQAPDVAGQQVAVKTPDPAKIGYIYDFSSIFANPSQASMMPSPYGPMNTVAPKQPQQAANQPLFQLASGFAEGGIVNSNDIQVGGSMDDLINILKGSA